MISLIKQLNRISLTGCNTAANTILKPCTIFNSPAVRTIYKFIEKPNPGDGKAFRRIIHYPAEYTVKPLEVTNLAGRDPVTGRVVANGIGGGIKHKYHWIKWVRDGPAEGPPQVEKVVEVMFDGCRTAKIALVAVGDEMKYILATENMKAGDLIRTSRFIPRIPGRRHYNFLLLKCY